MTTTVSYHADGYGPARPAINVKCHAPGADFWPPALSGFVGAPLYAEDAEDIGAAEAVTAAYDRVQSDFWQAAECIATERGLGEIAQEGRSGGWLVFTDPRLTGLLEDAPNGRRREAREFVEGYRAMTEWADAWIADAPRKVAALAQSLAMDENGHAAAARMFGRDR